MSRRELVEKTVLDLLQKSEEPLLSVEISETTGMSYQSVARLMKTLFKEKRVKRIPGPGHSYRYAYITHERPVSKKGALPVGQNNIVGVLPKKFTSEQLMKLCQ